MTDAAPRYATTPQWDQATAAVDSAASILLVTHVSPDGDAIGSLLGLANGLRQRGCQVSQLVVDGGVPDYLAFLPGADTVRSAASGDFDLLISLDSSDEERSGDAGVYGRAHSSQVMNIDHHVTNTGFGTIHLVLPTAVSTTEIVQRWLEQINQPLTSEIAVPLLTGLITDTIGFRTSNVTGETLTLAQRLMDAGASLNEIMQRTLSSKKYAVMKLWGGVLPSTQLEDGIISAVITQEDVKRAGLPEITDGGLVEFLVTANEAQIAVVFKEKDDGRIEVGFRSKPGYEVGGVAFSLGGGGHKQASGATIPGPLEAARARVLPLLRSAYQQGKPAFS
ncbi:MAG: bifunctional oligoribonuclease/PAP phosphatase NrnA [Anaerolineae bacterium]|nr:bifunctional oligoribonuclease/PAP phosphatase NrnA [Anaerolineae bacterium]